MNAKADAPPKTQKTFREAFAKLLEDPSRDKLHDLLRDSGGEFRDLDFKELWPAKAAVAKQVLGRGNIGGGALVVGVREENDGSLTPIGLQSFTDKADITGWIKGIVPSTLLDSVAVFDFDYPTGDYGVVQGKKFQILLVEPDPRHLPFLPAKEGDKIVPGTIYVRRDGLIDAATHDEVQRILNRRIEGGHSTQPELDLQGHLDQLRVLYAAIEKRRPVDLLSSSLLVAMAAFSQPNPLYPKESFDEFVSAQIAAKKRVIQRTMGTD